MAAKPDTVNLCRTKGDTFADQFTIQTAAGVAVDITGASFLLTVDPNPDPTSAATNLFQVAGVIVTPAAGILTVTPSAANVNIDPDTYFYDLQMTDGSGGIRTVAAGTYEILPQVTQP